MECRGYRERLIAYCAGRLRSGEAAEVESHLSECPGCAEFARRQSAAWSALDLLEAPAVAAGFDAALRAKLEAEQRRRWWRLPAWRPALSVALACLLLAAVVAIGRHGRPEPAQPGTQAHVESVDADRIERALDDVEMLRQLNLPEEGQTL